MQRAQKRDACLTEKFWWRRDVGVPNDITLHANESSELYAEMTIDEIVNGKVIVINRLIYACHKI